MFDLEDKALTRAKRADSPVPATVPAKRAKKDRLDSDQAVEVWRRLLDAYTREIERQEENRAEMAVDEDFYDNKQWRDEDKAALEARGQRALVYNVIATTVNWVLGTEKRGRSDHHILPRRKEHAKPAERKSQLLKYLSDCNRTPFHRSRAFADAVKVGVGWLEDGYEDDGENEPIYSRYESWRNMLWDSAAQDLDLKDARYVFRSKWVDHDIARAIFPNRLGLLEESITAGDDLILGDSLYGDDPMDAAEQELDQVGSPARHPNRYSRERVRIIECWFKAPVRASRLSGSTFSGELFDEQSPGHREAVESGEAELVEKPLMRVHVALFTVSGLLWFGPSPYRHNRYPFTPIWGNRRGRDGLPYGLIRGLRDINEDINKRASKALHLLSTKRTIADHDAVEDHDEAAEEVSRPDAYIVKKKGSEFRVETESELADAHMHLMGRSIQMIQQASGVTDENLGRKTNATAGVAIEARQMQGAMATTHYFDNLRFASQVQGEKQLSLVEQFMSEQRQFRITNMRGKPEYITVNDDDPDNDIVRSKADFVITEADWRASMREAAAEELMELLVKLAPVQPQLVMVMLDLIVESTDVPNREELVRRIRELTGMSDPDAEEPSEAEIARAQQQAEAAALEKAHAEATLREIISKAVKNEMQARQAEATAVKTNIGALGGPKRGAIDVAADVMSQPAVAPVTDELMREAGFVGRAEKEHAAAQEAAAQQAAQAQQPAAIPPQPGDE